MWIFNEFIHKIFDLFFAPFKFSPIIGLLAISFTTGIIILTIYRYTSNQKGIKEVKNKIKAYFLEVRLYKDDLILMLDAQKNILRYNLTYMKYALIPLLAMLIPIVIIVIDLNLRFGYSPLKLNESVIVEAKFFDKIPKNIYLTAPEDAIEIETLPLRIEKDAIVNWRIKALKEGIFFLKLQAENEIVVKEVIVSKRLVRLSPKKTHANFLDIFLYPGEKTISKDSSVKYIMIDYPSNKINIGGFHSHWFLIYMIMSIFSGFLLKGFFKVEI